MERILYKYFVSKLDNQSDAVEDKPFEKLSEAEIYAENHSLYDDAHSYSVKKRIDDFEFQTLKIYKLGQIAVRYD
jgi:hypothetical protein